MLKRDEDFRHLSAQVHFQAIMLDGMATVLFPLVPPTARANILAQMRRNAAAIGRKGTLSDMDAEFKADIRVRAQGMLEQTLAALEPGLPDDEDEQAG